MSKPQPLIHSCSEQIRIRGLVQGVGFRPTVYRIAQQMGLCGEVINDGAGVKIIVQAHPLQVNELIDKIKNKCPPLARIDTIDRELIDEDSIDGSFQYQGFTIRNSQLSNIQTGVIPDAATCSDCLRDVQDPDNRRSDYAFTNCTHCGPRLSIVEQIPYDRNHTSMKHFKLCQSCQQEYDDPGNRRFHAQPNACPDCGPVIRITDAGGNTVQSDDVFASAAQLIGQGHILAIKGIGGFQLACDANNDKAVKLLRHRKNRPAKALALMASSIEQIKNYCLVSEIERQTLESPAAPIVVLQNITSPHSLSAYLAPGQNSLGFVLPYSPLHHLLMQRLQTPVVLTSGNASEAPQCTDNQQAIDHLGHIANYFILHNRDIVNRIDDSVVRIISGQQQFYRRARGYAPAPLTIPAEFNSLSPVLALGGETKNTFCLLKNRQATLSQHMGNLEDVQTYKDYLHNIELYRNLFEFEPGVIVVDKHPEYLSSKLGRQWALEHQLTLIETQHHHAHVAACMADNQWSMQQGPVIGIALDGLGYGDDGTIWGGEFLLADYTQYTRVACLKPVSLPGAGKAIIEPWRNTYAQLTQESEWQDLADQYSELSLIQFLQQQPLDLLDKMIGNNLNSPMSSSCGRLFDAFAAALGVCPTRISYEGQAAMELESLISPQSLQLATPYPYRIETAKLSYINTSPIWSALLNDLQLGIDRALISSRFHVTLAQIIERMVLNIQRATGINTVALCGGVFQNATLLTLTYELLSRHSVDILCHSRVPCNDGGLALGQAAIATAQLKAGEV